MAKKAAPKKEPPKESPPDMPEIPSGYEEVGDYWEQMFVFDKVSDYIAGIYRGSVANIGENESNVHIFEVDGVRIGVWGSVVLDKRMDAVKMNAQAMLVYEGVEVSEKTGRTYKDFKVYQKKGTGQTRTPNRQPSRTGHEDDIPF